MSLADALDAPVIVLVRGEKVRLGVLEMDDLALIEAELIAAAKEEALAKLPNTATAADVRAVATRFGKMSVDALANHVFTLDGCKAFVTRELVKGGMSEPEAAALFPKLAKAVGFQALTGYAADASGIYPARDPETSEGDKTEGDDPNPEGGKAPETSPSK